MSRSDINKEIYKQTKLPQVIVNIITDYSDITCLFLVEKITVKKYYIKGRKDFTRSTVHWSAGTFFSKRKAILYFSKIGNYNRIMNSRNIGDSSPFRYQIFGYCLEPDHKISHKELIPIFDVMLHNKKHIKKHIGKIRDKITKFPYTKEYCPVDNKETYQRLKEFIYNGNASWKYSIRKYHKQNCDCGCSETDESEKKGIFNLRHYGWKN